MSKQMYIYAFTLFLIPLSVNAGDFECEQSGKINECISANENSQERSIEDFVCPSTISSERIAYQIVLDEKFQEQDKKIKEYLTSLEENKDYYFGSEAKEHVLKGIDLIEKKLGIYGEFRGQFEKLCNGGDEKSILAATMKCFGDKASVSNADSYFTDSRTCMGIAEQKLAIHRDVAYNVLQINKMQVRKDDKKDFFQKRRDKYDALLDIMMINLGYLERMWRKWPAKIKDNYL